MNVSSASATLGSPHEYVHYADSGQVVGGFDRCWGVRYTTDLTDEQWKLCNMLGDTIGRIRHHAQVTSDLTTAAEAVCEAIRRHVAAVEANTEDRSAAGAALVGTLDAYGVAVVNAGSELPDEFDSFDAWLDEEDGIQHPEEEPEPNERIAVFVRADFAVEDLATLRAAGLQALDECCGETVDGSLEDQVRTPADALGHLLGHTRSVFDDTLPGLRLLSEHVVTIGGVPEALDESPWEPLLELANAED